MPLLWLSSEIKKLKRATSNTKTSISSIYILVFLICKVTQVSSQQNTFIRDCNDPLITAHNSTSHTYCFHACGYLGNPSTDRSSCTAGGTCLCNYPCDTQPPTVPFGTDVCPKPSDPPDTDLNAAGQCTQFCTGACVGGQGMTCGESLTIGGPNTYAKICTCYCPPQPCAPNTTMASYAIAIIKKPVVLPLLLKWKALAWKVAFWKVFKIVWVLFKLCSLYLLKLFLFAIYYYIFRKWIWWEVDAIYGSARWVFYNLWEYFT